MERKLLTSLLFASLALASACDPSFKNPDEAFEARGQVTKPEAPVVHLDPPHGPPVGVGQSVALADTSGAAAGAAIGTSTSFKVRAVNVGGFQKAPGASASFKAKGAHEGRAGRQQ